MAGSAFLRASGMARCVMTRASARRLCSLMAAVVVNRAATVRKRIFQVGAAPLKGYRTGKRPFHHRYASTLSWVLMCAGPGYLSWCPDWVPRLAPGARIGLLATKGLLGGAHLAICPPRVTWLSTCEARRKAQCLGCTFAGPCHRAAFWVVQTYVVAAGLHFAARRGIRNVARPRARPAVDG